MATLTRTITAALATAGMLTLGAAASAQTATQADFDACNRAAQAGGVGAGSSSTARVDAPSADTNRQINSSGRVSSSAGSPGTNSGTTSSGAAGMPSASPRTSATDPQLVGMDATGHGSAAYQRAYRDCMKQRGF